MIGIPSSTYYDWYARWVEGGVDALADRSPRPRSVWNRIPDNIREAFVEFALDHEDLTPRELAVKYTDEKRYFVSESSAYRLLKAEDLITAPAHVVIRAADAFRDKTTRPNELWQTDFTYLKAIGWGWFYLSTILDDYSRYIIAWKLCTTMQAADVTDTLDLVLEASGCDSATVVQKPRLLSDNGSSYVAADLADYLEGKSMDHVRSAPHHPQPLKTLVREGHLGKDRLTMQLDRDEIAAVLQIAPEDISEATLSIEAAFTMRRRGVETRIMVGDIMPGPDRTLLRGLAKGHKWAADLQGVTPISQIARREKVTEAYIRTRAQLAFLAPSIQTAILDGTQPADLTLERLVRMQIPLDWTKQERLLGIGS